MKLHDSAVSITRRELLLSGGAVVASLALTGTTALTGARAFDSVSHQSFLPMVASCSSEAIKLGRVYIARQFNPEIGLYREAPCAAPNTYWVYSDAYLAGLDVDRWNAPVLAKWTVLVEGAVVPETVFAYQSTDLVLIPDAGNGYTVKSEMHDLGKPLLPNWSSYADRVLLAAINAQNAGNMTRADELLVIARSFWNGRGMADQFYDDEGYYETYHVALYYFATGDPNALDRLVGLQERDPSSVSYGGIYTEYDDSLSPLPPMGNGCGTDTNVETTSVTMRALVRWSGCRSWTAPLP